MEWMLLPWVFAAALVVWFMVRRHYARLVHRPFEEYLEAPPSYWRAPAEVKAKLTNGAGPDGCGWVVPDTIYGVRITEAANIHDWMYVWGDNLKDKDRADFTLLANMLRITTEYTTPVPGIRWFMLWLRHRRCLVYYEAVADFGARAFQKAHAVRPPGFKPDDSVAGLALQENRVTSETLPAVAALVALATPPDATTTPPPKEEPASTCPVCGDRTPYKANPCTKAPPGWYCTRVGGHTGPCAAVPDIEGSDRT